MTTGNAWRGINAVAMLVKLSLMHLRTIYAGVGHGGDAAGVTVGIDASCE